MYTPINDHSLEIVVRNQHTHSIAFVNVLCAICASCVSLWCVFCVFFSLSSFLVLPHLVFCVSLGCCLLSVCLCHSLSVEPTDTTDDCDDDDDDDRNAAER